MEQWRNVRPRLSPIINEMFFILIRNSDPWLSSFAETSGK